MGKSAIYYVAGKLMSGIDTNLCLIDPIQIQWMEGQIGALPVFKTKKDAEKYAEGGQVMMIRITQKSE